MLTAHDASGRFVCYGTYFRQPESGETYGAFPDDPDAVTDEDGNELVTAKRSAAYGFKLCPLSREHVTPFELDVQNEDVKCVCTIGDDPAQPMSVVGFVCWYVHKSGCANLRFAQYGDPRLNGAPVVARRTKRLVGMYMVGSWADETKAECVPCDLFSDVPIQGWDKRRTDVETEVAAGWGEDRSGSCFKRTPLAVEINGRVFAEAYDRRAKWVTHVYPDRDFVWEDECRYLHGTFADVVLKLERGETQLKWSNGAILDITDPPAGIGFELRFASPSSDPPHAPDVDPSPSHVCVDWY